MKMSYEQLAAAIEKAFGPVVAAELIKTAEEARVQVRPDGGMLHFQIGRDGKYRKAMLHASPEVCGGVEQAIANPVGSLAAAQIATSLAGTTTKYLIVTADPAKDIVVLPTGPLHAPEVFQGSKAVGYPTG